MKILAWMLLGVGAALGCGGSPGPGSGPPPIPSGTPDAGLPPLFISSVQVTPWAREAEITFVIDQNLRWIVRYGPGTSLALSTSWQSGTAGQQRAVLTGLESETTYGFQIRAEDETGAADEFPSAFTTGSCQAPAPIAGFRMVGAVAPNPPLESRAATSRVALTWEPAAVADFAYYELRAAKRPQAPLAETNLVIKIQDSTETAFEHERGDIGYLYYRIRVVNTCELASDFAAEVGTARYPIGNILPLHENAALTAQYPERQAYPESYGARTRFLKVDVSDRDAGTAYPVAGGTPSSVKLANNFQLYEFVWGAGTGWLPSEYDTGTFGFAVVDPLAVSRLQLIRELHGGPLEINSAFRSPTKNPSIGGATYSRHMYGDAFDVDTPNGAAGAPMWRELEGYACTRLDDAPDYVEPWYDDDVARVCAPQCGSSSFCTNGWLHVDWRWQAPGYQARLLDDFDLTEPSLFGCRLHSP